MSKLAIILCAALFASAANALYVSDQLDEAQEALNSLIDDSIAKVELAIADANQKSDEVIAQILTQTRDFSTKVTNDLSAGIQKAENAIKGLASTADSGDVSESTKLIRNLGSLADEALIKVTECFIDKYATAIGHVEYIVEISDDVLAKLNVHKEEAHACTDKTDGVVSSVKALACTNLVAAQAAFTTAKAVPLVTAEILKSTRLLISLPLTLSFCSTSKVIATPPPTTS